MLTFLCCTALRSYSEANAHNDAQTAMEEIVNSVVDEMVKQIASGAKRNGKAQKKKWRKLPDASKKLQAVNAFDAPNSSRRRATIMRSPFALPGECLLEIVLMGL